MSHTSEHRRLAPVLAKARILDIATNPAPEALFEALTAGFNIWCTPADQPEGWQDVPLIAGAFSKPCGFVGTAAWHWEGERIVAIQLETDSYDLEDHLGEPQHNRPEDIQWAEEKIRWLFGQAGVACPPVVE